MLHHFGVHTQLSVSPFRRRLSLPSLTVLRYRMSQVRNGVRHVYLTTQSGLFQTKMTIARNKNKSGKNKNNHEDDTKNHMQTKSQY